jgi:hypothetical protein
MRTVTIFAFKETSLGYGNHNLHVTKDNINAQIRDAWEYSGIVRHTRGYDAETRLKLGQSKPTELSSANLSPHASSAIFKAPD